MLYWRCVMTHFWCRGKVVCWDVLCKSCEILPQPDLLRTLFAGRAIVSKNCQLTENTWPLCGNIWCHRCVWLFVYEHIEPDDMWCISGLLVVHCNYDGKGLQRQSQKASTKNIFSFVDLNHSTNRIITKNICSFVDLNHSTNRIIRLLVLQAMIHRSRVAFVDKGDESWRWWINTVNRNGWKTHVVIVVRRTEPKVLVSNVEAMEYMDLAQAG